MAVIPFAPMPRAESESESKAAPPDFGNADYSNLLAVWGNGDACLGLAVFYSLTMRLLHAREKHPVFALGEYQALGVIGCEYRELEYAVEHESPERQMDEARDVIATCVRFLNGEYEGNAS